MNSLTSFNRNLEYIAELHGTTTFAKRDVIEGGLRSVLTWGRGDLLSKV